MRPSWRRYERERLRSQNTSAKSPPCCSARPRSRERKARSSTVTLLLENGETVDGPHDRRVGIAGRAVDEESKRHAAMTDRRHVSGQRGDVRKMAALGADATERRREVVVLERSLTAAERKQHVERRL